MRTLYKIKEEYLRLIYELETEEFTEDLEKRLKISREDINQKSISYLEVIRDREAFIFRIDNEIARLSSLKKRQTDLISKLKTNLIEAVRLFGEFNSGLVTFKTRKSSRVEILDEKKIPEKFKIIKKEVSADKKAIKNAIKLGEEVEGASIVDYYNLLIK